MTTVASPVRATPTFIEGPTERLFAVYWAPDDNPAPAHGALFFPPFAEEANKSRRMVALQARRLAAAGIGVLVVDLSGTGDSGGDFRNTSFDGWVQDLSAASAWLAARGVTNLVAWALRSGALLLAGAAESLAVRPASLLFWQPVTSGANAMRQFLRIRVAAAMEAGGETRLADLVAQLAAGEHVEIGGYELAPALYADMQSRDLGELDVHDARVAWFELAASAGRSPGAASRKFIDAWQRSTTDLAVETLAGVPFWNTAEIAVVDALLERSTRFVVSR